MVQPTMSSHPSDSYQATMAPDSATCDMRGCCAAANVRMIIPRSRFEADGIDHTNDPPTFDACELHWPAIRDACQRNGHAVVDTTGDLRQLAADFPTWSIFCSDGGRLYASARVNGSAQGATLDAYLVGQLRAQLAATGAPSAVGARR